MDLDATVGGEAVIGLLAMVDDNSALDFTASMTPAGFVRHDAVSSVTSASC